MPEEFEGDLAGAVFWGADLSGASFRDVNLSDATISHAWLVNVDIDALVDSVVINGVDVTAYVNERDPWYPLRAMLRPSNPEDMRATWAALEAEWAKTVTRALALPEAALYESVDDEWSFVQTLRHLVFVMDKWFTAPVLGESFHPIGLPNSGSVDFPWPGLDYDLTPSVADALAVRADRATRFRDYLASVATTAFSQSINVLENGENPLEECIDTVFEEEFWHNRYAAARPRAARSGELSPATGVLRRRRTDRAGAAEPGFVAVPRALHVSPGGLRNERLHSPTARHNDGEGVTDWTGHDAGTVVEQGARCLYLGRNHPEEEPRPAGQGEDVEVDRFAVVDEICGRAVVHELALPFRRFATGELCRHRRHRRGGYRVDREAGALG